MPRVIQSPQCDRDLIEIWVRVAVNSFEAADRLLDRLTDKFHDLADFPGLGRRHPELAQDIHVYPVGDYLIFYLAHDAGVTILCVPHGARRYTDFHFE